MDQHETNWPLVMHVSLATAFATLVAMPVVADCRLALVLALDVSSSVNQSEDALQRGGLAAALIAPEVEAAFFSSDQSVALAVYEWSGRYNQQLILDWYLIDTPEDLLFAAAIVGRSLRGQNNYPTAMGYALGFGAGLLQRAPVCLFQTIDMAGDGENNEGFPPRTAYGEFPFAGVTVNGLVISSPEIEAIVDLSSYYRTEVLFGPGAFLEVAAGFDDYERAMRRKLERELRPRAIGALKVPCAGGDPTCGISG